MIAAIFEAAPKTPKDRNTYLAIAGALADELKVVDGFISIERFESLVVEGKLLSLSFWRDERALQAWRNQDRHRQAQDKGRKELFESYRIRIANVVRDYSAIEREQAPADSRARHG